MESFRNLKAKPLDNSQEYAYAENKPMVSNNFLLGLTLGIQSSFELKVRSLKR